MPRIEVAQLSDLKTGDQIAVEGNVDDLDPSLLLVMDHTNGKYIYINYKTITKFINALLSTLQYLYYNPPLPLSPHYKLL